MIAQVARPRVQDGSDAESRVETEGSESSRVALAAANSASNMPPGTALAKARSSLGRLKTLWKWRVGSKRVARSAIHLLLPQGLALKAMPVAAGV